MPGSAPPDRDETVAGVPLFAQLAGALADAGYVVVRYDRRGMGQSGGRAESATLFDYAEDVRAVVRFLERRKDVDKNRIALVAHGDGGAIAVVAAQREKRVAAVALLASPGTTGAELVLEQQQQLLERVNTPEAERAAKIELQKKVHAAVLTGQGWEEVPAPLRKQAETPWFKSFLEFDPGKVIPRMRQPLFVARGDADPAHHADKLAALANARKKAPPAEVVSLPALVTDGRVNSDLIARLAAWLKIDYPD